MKSSRVSNWTLFALGLSSLSQAASAQNPSSAKDGAQPGGNAAQSGSPQPGASGNTRTPATARNQRQEERQEARQERQDQRRERLQKRQDNRSDYYSDVALNELDPWIARNNVPRLQRAAQVAGKALDVTERVLKGATEATTQAEVSSAVANQVDVANSATATSNRYGYNRNASADKQWFYDYYLHSPTTYSTSAAAPSAFSGVSRYYDWDNDGIYDSLSTFRDSDNNGDFDSYDRYDFTHSDVAHNDELLSDWPQDANRHTVKGKIFATKVAKVNGAENLIARLSNVASTTGAVDATVIDLGPAQEWKSKSLRQGDSISASGAIEQVGDKKLLMAETAKIGNQKEVHVSRSAPATEGRVVDVTETNVNGSRHTLAVIEGESSRQIVDLGPTERLKVKVEPQTRITVQGVPVGVRNHTVLQAERIIVDGQQTDVQRW